MSLANMTMGYGSEFHLLRLLGHHRNYLDDRIQKELGIRETIRWLDYPSADASFDKEWEGIECFRELERYEDLKIAWSDFWPQTGSGQTWDAIFTVGNRWFFVESKAHKKQTKASCSAKSESESQKKISNAFTQVANCYGVPSAEHWVSRECKSYQLANRLAFIYFCKKQGIDAALLYINFINGYDKPGMGKMSISTEKQWDEIWQHHFQALGIQREAVEGTWYNLCIDCTTEFTSL